VQMFEYKDVSCEGKQSTVQVVIIRGKKHVVQDDIQVSLNLHGMMHGVQIL